MDPVTAVGLIASIQQLVGGAIALIAYANDVKEANAERSSFTRHITNLLGLLNDLRERVEAEPSHGEFLAGVAKLGEKDGPLSELQEHIDKLQQKLKPPDSLAKNIGKSMMWTFAKKEVERLLTHIERVKSLIQFTLQNDHLRLSLAIKQDLASFKDDLQEGISHISLQQKKHADDELRQEALVWLSKLDFSRKQSDLFSRRQAGTGEWFLQHDTFQAWLDSQGTTLWCCGLPGAGKTIMASLVINYLENRYRDENAAVVYIYLSYKEQSSQTPTNLIAELVRQLVQQQPILSQDVHKFYTENREKNMQPLGDLSQLLVSEASRFSKVFVVVDALDESPDDENRDALLAEIRKLPPQGTHLLITSRQTPDSDSVLGAVLQLPIRAADEDIEQYIEERVKTKSMQKLFGKDPSLQQTVRQTVLSKAHGMFLLAQLQMDSLAVALNARTLRSALTSMPKKLDDIYDQAVQRIKHQDGERASLAIKILNWISYALRPLTVAELQQALAVQLGDSDLDDDGLYDEELMISVCLGLVTVDRESNNIRLVHNTAQEYFEGIRQSELENMHRQIANICLTYILFEPFNESYCKTIAELKKRLERYPFLRYAGRHWADHTREAKEGGVSDLALKLLNQSIALISCSQVSYSVWDSTKGGKEEQTRLHVAAAAGLTDIARYLLANGADVNAQASHRQTPLHFAARNGQETMIRLLLDNGANVEIRQLSGSTALYIAAQLGHVAAVRTLIDLGADASRTNDIGGTPLNAAAENGHVKVVQELIRAGVSVDGSQDENNNNSSSTLRGELRLTSRGELHSSKIKGLRLIRTPLLSAALFGRCEVVRLLLQHGASPAATDKTTLFGDNRTALHYAAERDDYKTAEILLEAGISVSAEDGSGQTALHVAARLGHEPTVRLLLENGALLSTDIDGRTAAHEAMANGKPGVLSMLLEHMGESESYNSWMATARLRGAVDQGDEALVRGLLGEGADPNKLYHRNVPLLHQVVGQENEALLELLLQHRAHVDFKGPQNWTPLHLAASRGYERGARILLKFGADVEATTVSNSTPLHVAIARGWLNMVALLLEHGVHFHTHDKNEAIGMPSDVNFPIELHFFLHTHATQRIPRPGDRPSILKLLVERGADLKTWRRHGGTMIHQLINEGAGGAPVIRFLLEQGVDPCVVDDSGMTALCYATKRAHTEAVLLLLGHGADVNQRLTPKKRRNRNLPTALHCAVRTRHQSAKIIRLLLDAGADIETKNSDGYTVLATAVGQSNLAAVDLLIRYGADINACCGPEGQCATHRAAYLGDIAMLQGLLRLGANMTAEDNNGLTLADWAKKGGDEAMILYVGSLSVKT